MGVVLEAEFAFAQFRPEKSPGRDGHDPHCCNLLRVHPHNITVCSPGATGCFKAGNTILPTLSHFFQKIAAQNCPSVL
jgi:hypothetical protein